MSGARAHGLRGRVLRVRYLVLLAVAVSAGVAGPMDPTSVANVYEQNTGRACGAFCLAFVDRYLQGQVPFETISKLCDISREGTTLHKLDVAAARLGYDHATFQFTGCNSLQALSCPAILHLSSTPGHFIVLVRWDPAVKQFLIYDPPRSVKFVAEETLTQQSSGYGLLLSTEPIHQSELRANSWSPWLYALAAGQATFLFTTLVALVVPRLRRGRSAPKGRMGVIVILLILCGCGAPLPSVESDQQVQSSPRADSVTTYRYDGGDILQGTELVSKFSIRNPLESTLNITSVDKGCACQPVTVEAVQRIPAQSEVPIIVHIATSGRSGDYKKSIILHTDSKRPPYDRIELDVYAHITAPLEAIPSQLNFGTIGAEAISRSMVVRAGVPRLIGRFRKVASNHPSVSASLHEVGIDSLTFQVDVDRVSANRHGTWFDIVRLRRSSLPLPNSAVRWVENW